MQPSVSVSVVLRLRIADFTKHRTTGVCSCPSGLKATTPSGHSETGDREASCQFQDWKGIHATVLSSSGQVLNTPSPLWGLWTNWMSIFPCQHKTKIAPLRSSALMSAQGILSSRQEFLLDLLPATDNLMTASTHVLSMRLGGFPPWVPYMEFVLFSHGKSVVCFSPCVSTYIHAVQGKLLFVWILSEGNK